MPRRGAAIDKFSAAPSGQHHRVTRHSFIFSANGGSQVACFNDAFQVVLPRRLRYNVSRLTQDSRGPC